MIRVTQSKNTFPKEMAIIKMCKEKRRRKVKQGHSYICLSIKTDFITHEYMGFLVPQDISKSRLNFNIKCFNFFKKSSFHMVLSIFIHVYS